MTHKILAVFFGFGINFVTAGLSHADEELPLICGPRCVQAILSHYGQQTDLVELIKEMQDGVIQEYSSVKDIQDSLQSRGIYSVAVRTGRLEIPQWNNPVVLHFAKGHFVVLEDTKGGYARIRDGVGMEAKWESVASVLYRQSGVSVLTSNSPIDVSTLKLSSWRRVLLAVCFVAVGGFGLLFRYGFRHLKCFDFREEEK